MMILLLKMMISKPCGPPPATPVWCWLPLYFPTVRPPRSSPPSAWANAAGSCTPPPLIKLSSRPLSISSSPPRGSSSTRELGGWRAISTDSHCFAAVLRRFFGCFAADLYTLYEQRACPDVASLRVLESQHLQGVMCIKSDGFCIKIDEFVN